MNKTTARTCYGCRAIIAKTRGGCAFGFKNTCERVPGSVVEIRNRRPAEPCFKCVTDKQFIEVSEYMERRVTV